MITINANTKIAALLKQNADALEAIVSISSKFSKLRNPLLRKVIAARTSIAMASKIGGCSVDDFFRKLQPLGFDIDNSVLIGKEKKAVPAFLDKIAPEKMVTLDVRPIFEAGKDPLDTIVKSVKTLDPGCVLKIINSFEPTPLIHLLGKQGFESYAEAINENVVNTYFYKKAREARVVQDISADYKEGWDGILDRFKGRLEVIDVRTLEMPLPMHTILEALETLPKDKALFVFHKRIPVFLLPELDDQHFSYRIKEVSNAEVHMLIYKN